MSCVGKVEICGQPSSLKGMAGLRGVIRSHRCGEESSPRWTDCCTAMDLSHEALEIEDQSIGLYSNRLNCDVRCREHQNLACVEETRSLWLV